MAAYAKNQGIEAQQLYAWKSKHTRSGRLAKMKWVALIHRSLKK